MFAPSLHSAPSPNRWDTLLMSSRFTLVNLAIFRVPSGNHVFRFQTHYLFIYFWWKSTNQNWTWSLLVEKGAIENPDLNPEEETRCSPIKHPPSSLPELEPFYQEQWTKIRASVWGAKLKHGSQPCMPCNRHMSAFKWNHDFCHSNQRYRCVV